MPTHTLTDGERSARPVAPENELRAEAARHAGRVRRLRIHAAAWTLGAVTLTALWAFAQWQANGAFERFATDGDPGDWNPTLWALGVGLWGLAVGIMALRVRFERPATVAELERELGRLRLDEPGDGATAGAELRRFARTHLARVGRLRFHVAAWILGMVVLTPLWALIEWQDNGGFERWSASGRPGDWEPWILYVAGIWALVLSVHALHVALERPTTEEEVDRELERLASHR